MAKKKSYRWIVVAVLLVVGLPLFSQSDSAKLGPRSLMLKKQPNNTPTTKLSSVKSNNDLPRGAVFCRMEDAVQKKAKVKIDVGLTGKQ